MVCKWVTYTPLHVLLHHFIYLARIGATGVILGGTVLVHDPVGSCPLGSSTRVENQSSLQADDAALAGFDLPVFPRGFPVACDCCPVLSTSVWVLPVQWTEE